MKRNRIAAILLLASALAGCVSGPSSRESRSRQTAGEWGYTVRPGDTLSAIATRYGVDMRTLARRNGLAPPYVIRVGQPLAIPARGQSVAGGYVSRPVVQPVPRPAPAPPPVYRPSSPAYAPSPAPYASSVSLAGAPRLVWPVDGQVVERFGAGRDRERVAMAAHEGTAVRSAAAGTVRLQGGRTVQVDHGDGWTTTYVNLGRLVVSDGERVRRGARLGFVGPAVTGRIPSLQFELRRYGTAVDPLPVLPQRL